MTLWIIAAAVAAFTSGCAKLMNPTPLPGYGLAPGSFAPGSPRARVSAGDQEELWVIARSRTSKPPAQPDKDTPGTGELVTKRDGEQAYVPLPLKHTEISASVSGYIGTVDVKQEFHNPYDTKIEAVYVFPLPHNAAVNEFIMTIGERRIRGVIRERKEAEQIYQEARSQGYVASLLTEERPNIFRQSVANIEPRKQIDVNIKYFQTLAYADGWYEFVFPMVVGPRYNPAGFTNGVGAVARGRVGISGQSTEVQYLGPNERSGHDIALHLDVDAGVTIEEFTCVTHRITKQASAPGHISVALAPEDRIPNKDFVLRYRVAGDRIKSNLLTHRDERGGYFTLMVYPPQDLGQLTRNPLELVFLLDCSGSMSGKPIEQAKAALRHALKQLHPGDSFQIINFSERASRLGKKPLEASASNIRKGLEYLDALRGDGPTEMIEGIKAALDFPHDPERLRFVCFLTDGFIGNEAQILGAVHERLGASRIFSFGVGSAPNRYLLEHLAKQGQGAVAFLGLHDDGAKVMDDFFERISHPALADINIEWGTMRVGEVYPSRMPDLFVGRPVILTGRFNGQGETTIHVSGKAGGEPVRVTVPVKLNGQTAAKNALPSVWARMKIADLADRATYDSDSDIPGTIKQVALDYGLMSAYTAFIAVDSSRRTEGSEGVTVPVAVPVPEGIKYHTTVQEQEGQKE